MKTKKYLQIAFMLFLPFVLKAQWSPVRFDHFNMFEKVVAVDEDNVFFIGRDYMNYRNFFMKTNDGGTTWDSVGIYLITTYHELRTIFFVNTMVGFIGGSKENKQLLLKTLDGGDTWTEITPDTTLNIMSIHFTDALNGYVTDGWDNLYFTSNGGANWVKSTITHNISDLYFLDNNTGFAAGGTASTTSAILSKTTDGGQNWTPLLTVANPLLFVSSFDKIDFVSPNEGFVFMGNTNQIYKTLDGGSSWDTITVVAVEYIADLDFTSANNGHLLSLAGELFATTDGGQTWTLEYATTWGAYGPSVYLYSIAFVNGTGYVGGSNGLVKKHVTVICDSISIDTIYLDANSLTMTVYNSSNHFIVYPIFTVDLTPNPYITLPNNVMIPSFLSVPSDANNGYTDAYFWGATIASPTTVPLNTLFTGTLTIQDPNDSTFTCSKSFSFLYGNMVTSVKELEAEMQYVYPNPSKGQVTVLTPTDKAQISVVNLLGQEVLNINAMQSRTDLQLDEEGIYIIYIRTEQGITKQKLIVER